MSYWPNPYVVEEWHELFPGYVQYAGSFDHIEGNNIANQEPPAPPVPDLSDYTNFINSRVPDIRQEIDAITPLAPYIPENDNIDTIPPAPDILEDDNDVADGPFPWAFLSPESSVADSPKEAEASGEGDMNNAVSNSDRVGEEFLQDEHSDARAPHVSGRFDDRLYFKYSKNPTPPTQYITGRELAAITDSRGYEMPDLGDINGTATADDSRRYSHRANIADLAPYAPTGPGAYRESVGEILTHSSWMRVIARLPPGHPLPEDKQPSPAPEPVFEPAVDPEYDYVPAVGHTQCEAEDSIAAVGHMQYTAEDDIYGATPSPAPVEDPHDADYDYVQAEAEPYEDRLPDGFDVDEDEDEEELAHIPDPKEDADDEDFVPKKIKRASWRKAPGTGRAAARAQGKNTAARAQGGVGSGRPSGRRTLLAPEARAPMASLYRGRGKPQKAEFPASKSSLHAQDGLSDFDDDDDEDEPQRPGNSRTKRKQHAYQNTAAYQTPDAASPFAAPSNDTGLGYNASAEEEIPQERLAEHALQLQIVVSDLRAAFRSADAQYEEAINNPRVRKDPRTKKRRAAKMEDLRSQLRLAVEEQTRFHQRYDVGPPAGGYQTSGADTIMTSTASAALPSSLTVPAPQPTLTRLQVLEQELNAGNKKIRDLQRKVAHCQARLDAVEADPEKFVGKRLGFKQGRVTRLDNAKHSLSHNMELLQDKQRLYDEEYKKVHMAGSSKGQNGQPGQPGQHKKPNNKAKYVIDGHPQPSVLQPSTPHKRKASEMDAEEEEEQDFPAGSKPRLELGTPVLWSKHRPTRSTQE